ncbi:MAG TPA: NAD(P)/FAD-dependent oxidoreductase [Mycobacteriales bacterium]|nr:NAD(P)/FAD-dependent oxidoreductase [Mycobacteriales bacterium]
MSDRFDVAVVGAGFTGLTAAMTLARAGRRVVVLEQDPGVGGLGGTFTFGDGVEVEKFYHHWFTNDRHVPELVSELGMDGDVVTMPSRTGMYLNGRIWRLSTPLDLLRFSAIPLRDRIKLGLSTLKVRKVQDWKAIEHLTIREWLEPLCGRQAYARVWEPLVRAKFGKYADEVNAVWMWKKLVLRGSTRNSKGGEELAYFKGGFGRLASAVADDVRARGGEVRTGVSVTGVETEGDRVVRLRTSEGDVEADAFLFTCAFEQTADLFDGAGPQDWLAQLRRVNHLGNLCLVLRLTRSLSETYWLNVNDPGFPFVGVIEHTNFDSPAHYGGDRIAYLSRYLDVDEPEWSMTDEEYLDFALGHLQRMFPDFDRSWIREARTWRARYAQPVTERGYSEYLPPTSTPYANAQLQTMAHIYPEDRGTNYAIRDGRAAAQRLLAQQQPVGSA